MVGAPFWRYIGYWSSVGCIVAGMLVINKAAADAQIEGKFHIAQSFAEVGQEEPRTPAIGRALEDHDLESLEPGVEDDAFESKGLSSPRHGGPLENELNNKIAPQIDKISLAVVSGTGRLRSSPRDTAAESPID